MQPQYAAGQILAGTVYRVIRHLATGGMGSVYDVEDTTVEKRYVLKTLHPQLVSREDLARRMRDEAKSLAKLQHPNIVDVITAGVTTDAVRMPFYVMERLIGQNLRVVLEKKGSLDLTHAYRIAIDVADALEHAHENYIVHRDVKPENIFLHRNANGTTTTKLLDFGIVRLLDRNASNTHGKFIGTLRYASPEQIRGDAIGPPTDIYSLGLVLFEMLCGRGPFDDAGDAYAIGAAHAEKPAPSVADFAAVSPAVERLVARSLEKDPARRPRDCFAFASELRALLKGEAAGSGSATVANVLTGGTAVTEEIDETRQPVPTGPTLVGMIPPSTPPFAAASNLVPVSPIAPTVAADEGGMRAASTPRMGAAPSSTPLPAKVGPLPVDREAPTRASAKGGETYPLAPNDTCVELGLANEEAVSAALGERAPLVVPGIGGASPPGDIVFPVSHASATGPFAGEARTRPPERGPFVLVGAAALIAGVMIGGAALAVKRPWRNASETPRQTIVAPPAGSTIATATAPIASVDPLPKMTPSAAGSAPPLGVPAVPARAASTARPPFSGAAVPLSPPPTPRAKAAVASPSGYSPAVKFE